MTAELTGAERINNGRRATVTFGPYTGPAGIVEREGVTLVAFAEDYRRMAKVEAGTIDGASYRVTDVSRSEPARGGIKGFVRLTVAPA